MQNKLKIAVIGAGKMGQNHMRVYSQLKDVDLVGVYDLEVKNALMAADLHQCVAFSDISQIVEAGVDAVSIASSTTSHYELGKYFLGHGIACLIEKPLAQSKDECISLIEIAKSKNAILMVGHIERFNPAVRQLASILKGGHKIRAIEARRMSFASSRITDVDVTMDLMVHDIDIILYLLNYQKIKKLEAISFATAKENDYVSTLISFDSGTLANITASRVTQNKIRELFITTNKAFITLDFISQEIFLHRQQAEPKETEDGSYIFDLQSERVVIRNSEPLVEELKYFLNCVKNRTSPEIGGQQALAALEVVWGIQKNLGR